MRRLLAKIRKLLRDRRTRQMFTRIVSVTAAIVVFVTTYALVLPAITMEIEADCGIEAHQHDDSCYEYGLICGLEESDQHQHGDGCYGRTGNLICGKEVHVHSEACYHRNEAKVMTGEISEPDDGSLMTAVPSDAGGVSAQSADVFMEEGISEDNGTYEENGDGSVDSAETFSDETVEDVGEGINTDANDVNDGNIEDGSNMENEAGTLGDGEAAEAENGEPADSGKPIENGEPIESGEAAAIETDDSAVSAEQSDIDGQNVQAEEEEYEEEFVPALDPVFFQEVLNDRTGIYYYHTPDGETVENSADITDWKNIRKDTELGENDLIRVYLAYTIPAGSLNATNGTARYRLPGNLHLSDGQVNAINQMENGIAAQYADYTNLQILDPENYHKYLGAEAVDGTRTPDQSVDDYLQSLRSRGQAADGADTDGSEAGSANGSDGSDVQEFISATVQVENFYDTDGSSEEKDALLGQDLIFTFSPYTIEENRHAYDSTGQQTKIGRDVRGWLTLDFNMQQVDWIEQESTVRSADIVFAAEGTGSQGHRISEIHTELTLVIEDTEKVSTEETADPDDNGPDTDPDNPEAEISDSEAEENGENQNDGEPDADDELTDQDPDQKDGEPTEEKGDKEDDRNYPAQSFEDTITVRKGTLSTDAANDSAVAAAAADSIQRKTELTVSVVAEEGTFPEGTTMILTPVTGNDLGTVAEAVEGAVEGRTAGFHAVDISFCDVDGKEIEPRKPIKVSMQSESIRQAVENPSTDTVIVHLEDGKNKNDGGDEHEDAGKENPSNREANEDTGSVKDSTADNGDNSKYDNGLDNSAVTVTTVPGSAEKNNLTFESDSFSVYAIVYTVDFHWEVNGKTYEFSIPGGGFVSFYNLVKALGIEVNDPNTPKDEIQEMVDGVESIEFSNPKLVSVSKIEEDTTAGAIKDRLGLECEYSADLTQEAIAEMNAQEAKAGDWALISLKPFATEESMTVTMKNGDQWTVKVTDAHEIVDAEKETIDPNKSYLICYQVGDTYYLLKNDGSVDSAHHPDFEGDPDEAHNFEHLNSTYAWSFNHIFKEQDVEHHLDKNYYLIRPIDDKAKTLALNNETSTTNPLVQQGNNNIAVIQSEGGLILEGYHNIGTENEPRYIHLGFNGSSFVGVDADGVIIHIYEMDNLPTYDYTVRSADENWGTVTVSDGTQQDVIEDGEVVAHYYAATSDANKMNNGIITATPNNHTNNELSQGQEGYGQNKWLFDHWEQDGLPLDRAQYPAMINSNTLPIPFNGSNLVAYFRQNPYYIVPDGEKEPTSIDDMSQWLTELQNRDIPLETASTKKSAEVYDYTNRIYRVDLSTKANFQTFIGSIDMAFCMDVSASMKFPSKLVEAETNYNNNTNPIPIYKINNSGYGWSNKSWLDTNRTYSNPYYLIADEAGTATVFKIYYEGGNWRAQDASRNQGEKTFRIGDDFETAWTKDTQAYKDGNKNHPFNAGDNDNTTYIIYNNGDSGHDRFYYLQESFKGGSGELNTIAELLKVAGAASPNVRIAYNSFNGNLATGDDYWEDFAPASAIDVAFRSASDGGTRPDKAFEDLEDTSKYHWSADVGNRYVVLITDGVPQSGGLPKITEATNAATHIKEQLGVKIITIGLSMDDVTEGKKLLYDIANKDKNGDKMFYLAESGDDLQGIIRKITKTIMEDAVVIGDITDTVGEAFYLVDKETGMPLGQGDMIDIEGNCTTDENQAAGIVQEDGKTVKWLNQSIDHTNGWHGVVYVKAQEELLGGNAVNTNAGAATVVATKYRAGGEDVYFDTTSVV